VFTRMCTAWCPPAEHDWSVILLSGCSVQRSIAGRKRFNFC